MDSCRRGGKKFFADPMFNLIRTAPFSETDNPCKVRSTEYVSWI
jgi:hypothetical protein